MRNIDPINSVDNVGTMREKMKKEDKRNLNKHIKFY